jgi:hypothetical protein
LVKSLKDRLSIQWTNGFWVASLDQIVFLYFLKLFVNMHFTISFVKVKIS